MGPPPEIMGEPSPKFHSQFTIVPPTTVLVSINCAKASAKQLSGLLNPALGLLFIITFCANKTLSHPKLDMVL